MSGDGVDNDPNNITQLSRPGPLYVGIQALQSVQFEGQLARNAAEYVQQIAGNSRQQIGFDLYQMDPVTIDPHFYSVYGSSIAVQGGGGLLDMHKMQQLARAVNDSIYIGIGKVYEALVIGTGRIDLGRHSLPGGGGLDHRGAGVRWAAPGLRRHAGSARFG